MYEHLSNWELFKMGSVCGAGWFATTFFLKVIEGGLKYHFTRMSWNNEVKPPITK